MEMPNVQLPRSLVNRILQHAQQSPQDEVCGLISEKDGRPSRCYPVPNAAGDRRHRFDMDPAQLIAAMRRMRDDGEELFAIYHSHPDAPALPSPQDIRLNEYPDAVHLIVSLNTEGVLEMRAFRIVDEVAMSMELELVEG